MTRALLVLNNENARQKAVRWCERAPHGTRVEYKRPVRSLNQNALMWKRLTEIAERVDWYGRKHKAEEWKDIFTAALRKAEVVPGIDPGTFVVLGIRTSDMSKEEMTNLLELIAAFAAEQGVELTA